MQGQVLVATSTGRCNTFSKLLCWRIVPPSLPRSLVELSRNGIESVLVNGRQVHSFREVLSQQAVGVLGWGETGHRVICEIVYQSLSIEAQNEVDRLISLDSDFESFAVSAKKHPRLDRARQRDSRQTPPQPRLTRGLRYSRRAFILPVRAPRAKVLL